jgi:hypothetical protein
MTNDDLLKHIWDDRRQPNKKEIRPAHMDEGDKFLRLLCKMRELHDAKGADYGDGTDAYSNFRRSSRLGVPPLVGCLVRLSDKFERVIQLSKHKAQVKDESIVDTLIDLANYALIAIILYDEEKQS